MAQLEGGLDGLYPETWDEYVGQDKAKHQLRIACEAAKARNKPLAHVMIASQYAGLGKTALAFMIAREMDRPIMTVSGAMKPNEVRFLFTRLDDDDILFIDEIHKLADGSKSKSEWLLHYLENGTLMGPMGAEPAPRVTVIGATTDVGKLPKTVRDRFRINPMLVPYTDDQGAGIVASMAGKVLVPDDLPVPDLETALQVTRAANNNPRLMRHILSAMLDLAVTGQIVVTDSGKYEMDTVLDFVGVTPDGLSLEAVRYLHVLYEENKLLPVGAAMLTARLGVVGTELAEIERLLLDKELISTTKGGRILTSTGTARAKKLEAAA